MQDLRSIPGCATGRLFGFPSTGGGTAGLVGTGTASVGGDAAAAPGLLLDRRLRPHPQQNLRCPRCDSLSTKFCYYNNYNLSQPRHFCKSCRRYWTMGGVLRNVPAGGGCRKPKRSSSSSKTSKSSSINGREDNSWASPAAPSSASSSDSSSLTAANIADGSAATQEPSTLPPSDKAALDSYATVLFDSINEGEAPPTTVGIFPEHGSFTSLIAAAANPDMIGLNFGSPPEFHMLSVQQQKATLPQPRTGNLLEDNIGMPGIPVFDRYVDHKAHIEKVPPPPAAAAQGRSAAGPPVATLDWPRGMVDTQAGLFDADSDHGGYWNPSQWGEIDPSLFLP